MQEFCCFIVFLCQYIHSFIFPEMAGGGGATAPLATPLNPPLLCSQAAGVFVCGDALQVSKFKQIHTPIYES